MPHAISMHVNVRGHALPIPSPGPELLLFSARARDACALTRAPCLVHVTCVCDSFRVIIISILPLCGSWPRLLALSMPAPLTDPLTPAAFS